MKFYYNGKLIRTSNHNYTHAVINTETGAVIGCRTSENAAQSIISSEISAYRCGVENGEAAIKALKVGNSGYWARDGRRKYPHKFTQEDSIERYQSWIQSRYEAIERIQKNWKVVELEVR